MTRERLHVSYGPIERNHEVQSALRVAQVPGREPFAYEQHAYRKRRFETWWENGQKMGRWDWVSADHPESDASGA